MYQDILKMKQLLDSRKPYDTDIRKQLKNDELCDLVYTALHLDGSVFSKEQIGDILQGNAMGAVKEATIQDHMAVEHHVDVFAHIADLLAMDTDIDLRVLEELNDILCGSEGPIWRSSNPILYTYDYLPPYYNEVNEKVSQLIRWYYQAEDETQGNHVLRAALLHNKIIELYPFAYANEATARVLMYFSLMRLGYPIFELRVNEQEYNDAIIEYLKHKNVEPFYKILERSLYNRLNAIVQITDPEY